MFSKIGEFPRHIHLFIERINPFDLPSAEDKLKNVSVYFLGDLI
jgi:hypothetical protein